MKKLITLAVFVATICSATPSFAQNGYGYEGSHRASSKAPYIALGIVAIAAIIAVVVHDNDHHDHHHHHHHHSNGGGGSTHGHSHSHG